MVSTSVGSGKTTIAIDWMLQFAEQLNWIYVAPTIRLINETEDRIKKCLAKQMEQTGRSLGIVQVIHSKQGPNVTQRALNKLSENDLEYNIILITTETFMNILPNIPDKSMFGVVLDEAFKPYDTEQYQSNNKLQLLTELFDDDLHARNADLVNKIVGKQFNGINEYNTEKIINICNFISNPALQASIITKTDNLFEIGYYVKPQQFEKFGEVILMAANFESSILYHIWSMLEVIFKHHHYFTDEKLTNVHKTKGHLVDIFYLLHPDDHSSLNNLKRNFLTAQEREREANMTVASYLLNEINLFFDSINTEYLLTINKPIEDMGIDTGKAELIPVRSHGLNQYEDQHNCVTLAITNANPQTEIPYLKKITGMTDEQIHAALRIDAFYQALGRTSVRNRLNDNRKIFIVPSKTDATYLNNLFEGSVLHGQLGNLSSLKEVKQYLKKGNLGNVPAYNALVKEKRAKQTMKRRYVKNGQDTTEVEQAIDDCNKGIQDLKEKQDTLVDDRKKKLFLGLIPRGLNANNYPINIARTEAVQTNTTDYLNYLEGLG